jgi:hypothetical protein
LTDLSVSFSDGSKYENIPADSPCQDAPENFDVAQL